MTISVRNQIIKICTILSFVEIVLFIAISGYYIAKSHDIAQLKNIFTPFLLSIFSAAACFILSTSFKKTTSIEFFFLFMFIFSLSIESFKVFHLIIKLNNLSAYFDVILTRLLYFARFFGILSMFSASLFACNLNYQKYEIITGFCMLIAFMLSASIIIDSDKISIFSAKAGMPGDMLMVGFLIEFFSIINFFMASILRNYKDYRFLGLSLIVLIIGRELFLYNLGFLMNLLSLAVFSLGVYLFGKILHSIHLWS